MAAKLFAGKKNCWHAPKKFLVFTKDPGKQAQNAEAREAELYCQIGQLKVELDWLKKNLPLTSDDKRKLLDSEHPENIVTTTM
ncbi:MAG: hypothetical protein LBG80_18760 [Bacteroidales bacterium]|jgi:putative transposase|nr:hypothetical protein [Bacteroidales bacterium]